ncbi:MAG TPA: twin-arginine translocation signal domain-containing protein [Candidatus Angelobacter sp.]|nr:twin-arginine translocation signal domain-containing protein [Candidatus Angelobacter sp.]
MAVSRRKFLQNSALAAVGCAVNPVFAASHSKSQGTTQGGATTNMIAAPSRQQFTNAIGSSFEVTLPNQSQPVWLRLLSVKDLPALAPVNTASMAVPPPKHAGSRTVRGFILAFNGGPLESLRAGTYTFQSSSLGKFSLFITPAGPQQYSAVFAHI